MAFIFQHPLMVGLFFAAIVGGVWMYWWRFINARVLEQIAMQPDAMTPAAFVATYGQVGDSFGIINSLCTSLALAVVAAGFWHEHQQSEKREDQHREQLKALAADAKLRDAQHAAQIARMGEQTEASLKLLQFDAKRFGYERVMKALNVDIPNEFTSIALWKVTDPDRYAQRYVEVLANKHALEREIQDLQAWFDDASRGKI